MTRLFAPSVIAVLALEATAGAQGVNPNDISISSFNPEDAVAPVSAVEGPGVKIGEGTVLRPVFGVETGVVSNVFYEDTDTNGAGILRLVAQIGAGSLTGMRLNPGTEPDEQANEGSFQYRADVRASYDLVLSGNEAVSDTGGLGLGLSLHGLTNPSGRLSFGIDEDFVRLIRAANFETDANTNRDINNLTLKLIYHPNDRSVGGYLYFNNTFDIFERSEQRFANRMFNRFGIHPIWHWLPQTQLYADVSWGAVTPLGTASTPAEEKSASYPLQALAGISTLLSVKTTFNFYAGYTNGFYKVQPSFSAPMLGASLGYRYSPLGRAQLSYAWQYQDSINANYYRDHVVQLSIQQLFAPFVVMVQPELHFREYNGIRLVQGNTPTRNDVIMAVVAGIHYNFRNWIAATLNYRFSSVQTNFVYMAPGMTMATNPSYVRHELLLGVRFAL